MRDTRIRRLLLAGIAVFLLLGILRSQDEGGKARKAFWVDSMYRAMTPDERIGQIFMIRAHSDLGPDHVNQVKHDIRSLHVGGLCFFQGTPARQIELIGEYQELSRIPLLVSMDAEWGPGMRLKEEAMSYPRQLMLGAIQDNRLLYRMGAQVAEQLQALGVHMNFAPVVDINNNPSNPVIHDRSFGEDKYLVAAKGYQYMKGMQDNGVLACAKHFPGHGDTDVDSHHDLPIVSHDRTRLDSLEFYPFRVLIDKGIAAVMVAHMEMPALDSTPNLPATLSHPITTGFLREKFGFEGLIITDAMEMQGMLKHHSPEEAAVLAFQAGSDILLLPLPNLTAFKAIQRAVRHGDISEERLEASVRRILAAKFDAGLEKTTLPDTTNIENRLLKPEYLALKHTLIRQSLTVVRNTDRYIPVGQTDGKKIAVLDLDGGIKTRFASRISDYVPAAEILEVSQNDISRESGRMLDALGKRDLVIVGLQGLSKRRSAGFGVLPATRAFLASLEQRVPVILVVFGTPYSLEHFAEAAHLIMAYDDAWATQELAAQAVMGAYGMQGKLPVSVLPAFPIHSGENTRSLLRLGFGIPEETGMRSDKLARIDTLVGEMLDLKAAPGCQVLVAKDGLIVYEKSFGYHRYKQDNPVDLEDIYDVASITKIAATTLAIMRLVSEGEINVYNTLGFYLPELEGTNKADLVIADVMAHQAGLHPWVPFFKFTMSEGRKPHPLSQYYQKKPDSLFSIRVAEDMYLRHDYIPQIWDSLYYSRMTSPGRYKYSDLGFYLLSELVRTVSGDSLHRYVEKTFYRPMGLRNIGYLPLERHDRERIIPTEEDRYFRFQRIHGYVHDMGAAMLGGVSGHAGLFSNARDLAIVMQMLLNKGYYGGTAYLDPETVLSFTRRVKGSTRRGLGFDMKELNYRYSQPTAHEASPLTYGHLGFTGTCAWNDPKEDLVFVFLSNRTYPKMENNLLGRNDFRERFQSLIYQAIEHN